MHTPEAFAELLLILLIAVGAAAVFLRLRLPAVLGYLAVGIAAGPTALGIVQDMATIQSLAELGVVLLLFTIGLEFSLPDLVRLRGALLGLGGAEVGVAAAVTFGVALLVDSLVTGWPAIGWPGALVLGGVVAMSSTALVTKQLTDQLELGTRHGRAALGVLLFQDLAVVPFLVLISGLSDPAGQGMGAALGLAFVKGVLAVAVILAAGRFLLQRLLVGVASLYSGELFTLAALTVALGAAWWTSFLGLSPALGAFVAGMMLGESSFRHAMAAEIRPFRDVLLALFFVSVGMLLDLSVLPYGWPWILLLFAGFVAFKLVLVFLLALVARMPAIVAMRTAVVLAHGGEFGFALLTLALSNNLLPPDYGQVVLAALLLSMASAPLALRFNEPIARAMLPRRREEEAPGPVDGKVASGQSDHVLLVGFGRVGQQVGRLLDDAGLEWHALDADPVRVINARAGGAPVSQGDGTRLEVLRAAGLDRARALVLTLDDHNAAIPVLRAVRHARPRLPILVRARDDSHLTELQEAGATEVVPETLEAGLMVGAHVLFLLGVPRDTVMREVQSVRRDRYSLLSALFPGARGVDPEALELRAVTIPSDGRAVGSTLAEIDLASMGVSVTALNRGSERLDAPSSDTRIEAEDTVLISGTASALDGAEAALVRG